MIRLVLCLCFVASFGVAIAAPVRIKDIADFDGVRGNDLVGYGLVVGLNGTGDSMRNAPFTEELLSGLLESLGVNVNDDELRSKNVAAVIVTASLPEFSRAGSRVDVGVSTIGDAKSLLGGTLVMTPLKAADGNVYAVAQGSIISAGISASGDAGKIVMGVPTAGKIPVGARIEREVDFDFSQIKDIRIALRNADFTTAARVEDAINESIGKEVAVAYDSGTILVDFQKIGYVNPSRILSKIENILIDPDARARVVVDHRSGTIVMGGQVRISQVAVSHGGLTLKINESPMVVQPNPFSTGETVTVPRTYVEISNELSGGFVEIAEGRSLDDLISGLNALGVSTRDMIDILKSIHSSGALHADILID